MPVRRSGKRVRSSRIRPAPAPRSPRKRPKKRVVRRNKRGRVSMRNTGRRR